MSSMSISGVTSYASVSYSSTVTNSASAEKAAEKDADVVAAGTASSEKAGSASGTNDSGKTDSVTISGKKGGFDVQALVDDNNRRLEDFKKQLMSMISRQGDSAKKAESMYAGNGKATVFGLDANGNLDPKNLVEVSVTPEESAEAAKSIADGGEWSVNSVADRIMNMAYALSGGDQSKLETLRSAVQEGFKQAGFDPEDRENSNMPSITGQTYDEIMSRFDDWANGNGPASGASSTLASVTAATASTQAAKASIAGAHSTIDFIA